MFTTRIGTTECVREEPENSQKATETDTSTIHAPLFQLLPASKASAMVTHITLPALAEGHAQVDCGRANAASPVF